ncbi:MAG: hypothetical protein OSJ72_07970 [Lachnospiraceae bacterium]|nr:hypothetical protein [Lachnospiraceae bacterium]
MQVIEYHNCGRREHWLEQIKKSDWSAGQFLYQLLYEKYGCEFFQTMYDRRNGEPCRVYRMRVE